MDPSAILDRYALKQLHIVRRVESYGNENWLVEEEGGARYVLRRQLLNGGTLRLDAQIALQTHLVANDVPTALIVAPTDGSDRVVDDEGVAWLLLRYIEGEEYDFARPEQAAEAGALLARFHEAARSFAGAAPPPEHKPSITSCWATHEQDLDGIARAIDGAAEDELQYVRVRWAWAQRALPLSRLQALPAGYVHGDFHGRNVIFDGDKVVALLDFDDMDRGPFAYDIAGGAVKFSRESRGAPPLRASVARRFLDGYQSVRTLTAEERGALPVLAAMAYPPNPVHYAWWRDRHGRDPLELLREDVANMRWLEAEMSRIGPDLFAGANSAPSG